MTAPEAPPARLAIELSLLALLATLWASSYALIKIGVATIPPITLIAGRSIVAAAILCLILRARGLRLPTDLTMWGRFFRQSCLNTVIPFILIAWAERTVDSGLAAILNSTSPIFTFLITWTITRHEPVSARKLIGVVAGMTGILLIVGFEALAGLGEAFLSQVALVVATVAYAWAAIYGSGFRGVDPMLPGAGSLIAGVAMLVPLSLLIDQPWTVSPSTASVLGMLGLAIFPSAIGVVIYFRLLATLGSVGTTAQAYLRVPIGVAIGILFMGESLAPTAWAGLVFVFVGVAAMTIPERTAGAPSGMARRER